MGEMERLKEFGFKSNADLFEAAGGDLTKLQSTSGKTLDELFAGGTAAGAETASAKVGTILGTFESSLANVGEKMLNGLSPALDVLIGKAEQYAPVVEEKLTAFGSGVMNVITALQPLTPALSAVASVVGGALSLAFNTVGSILNDLVIPAIQWLGDVVEWGGGVLDKLFPKMENVGNAADEIKKLFGGLSEVVSNVTSGLGSLVGSIGGWISNKLGIGKNATGTMSFGGGLTQINENNRGEIVQLPSGSKIYPYQTTQKMLRKALSKSSGTTNNNIFNVNIDARGSNLTNSQVYRLKKEIVNDIVEALDNTVPA